MMSTPAAESTPTEATPPVATGEEQPVSPIRPPEFGGPKGPEPTRYGDWERKGRCIDF